MAKYETGIEQLPSGKWAVILFDSQEHQYQGISTYVYYCWRTIALILPMGEKAYKRDMYQLGARVEVIDDIQRRGLAGMIIAKSAVMVFDTELAALAAIDEILEPQLLALTLASEG